MTQNEEQGFDAELAEDYEILLKKLWPACPNDIGITLAVMAKRSEQND